ncbi:hypothetical protein [uncultured Halomonas sp.]|uniref:DUF7673 family protein n=1 Tax=uncultured Halomonas sp. TaxID=173971 RepID=UPI00262CFC98|nr:hypothetical protein [uncultured Halomonas sp.]
MNNDIVAAMNDYLARRDQMVKIIDQRETQGVAALERLFNVAQNNTGQSIRIRRFLLGLYNGAAWPMNLNDLRGLDWDLQQDVLATLAMDMNAKREIHCYIENAETEIREWHHAMTGSSDSD